MEIGVLGPFEVLDGDRRIELNARKPRALLAALALRHGAVASSESLIDALWGESAPDSAASLLRVYVAQLRRVLPEGRLVTRAPGYLLRIEPGELDALRFEELHADARRASAEGDVRLARALYGRALALWRGDALADLVTEPFAHLEAARLDDLRLACLEERLDADLALGRHAEVLPELERLAAEHRLRERLQALQMLALYRAGRQAEALERFQAARSALVEELGLEPGEELRELERRILRHDPSLASTAEAHSSLRDLPLPRTATVGRRDEVDELGRLVLDPECRLATVTGPGGIGKTRVALEVAHAARGQLAHGAAFVDLAPVGDPAQLLSAIGRALGLRETGSVGWRDLVEEHLRPRELLLVLDNMEHLTGGGSVVSELLDTAPHVTVLATSRRVLRLAAEHVRELRPLDRQAARELLVSRARAAGVDVDASDADLEEIGARLEGVPLAIELAAPRLRAVAPAELARSLDSRLGVLGGGSRDAPLRHRTMRAAIDWSFELLAPGEQELVARLAVFRGGFTREAVAAVAGDETADGALSALVDASIVIHDDGRYRLLDVVREYAAELPNDGESARRAHAAWVDSLVARAEPELTGAEQASWLDRLEIEHDNVRAALDWAEVAEPELALRVAAGLGRFWYVRGYLSEGLDRIQRVVAAADGDRAVVANAVRTGSALALLRGEYPLARSLAGRALELYRAVGDEAGAVRALNNLGAILQAEGDLDGAAATLQECIEASRVIGDDRLTALALNNRGDVALSQGDLVTAAARFEESLALLRAEGDVANVARALYNLGAVEVGQGRIDEAEALLRESRELATRVDDREDVAWCLIALAAVAAERGQDEVAGDLLAQAEALLERIGATMKPNEQRLYDRTRERLGVGPAAGR